jgi:hypothetical protein
MKVLFQGGWKAGRDPDQLREMVAKYCVCLASHIVNNNHAVVLTSTREFDGLIAEEIVRVSQKLGRNVKDHLIYLLPEREATLPTHGRVVQIPKRQWWVAALSRPRLENSYRRVVNFAVWPPQIPHHHPRCFIHQRPHGARDLFGEHAEQLRSAPDSVDPTERAEGGRCGGRAASAP